MNSRPPTLQVTVAPGAARRSDEGHDGTTAGNALAEKTFSRSIAHWAERPLIFWAMALVIFTVGLAVRLYRIDATGYNSDEAVYAGQAASISGDAILMQFFPVFRAHPLLLQSTLASIYEFTGVSDLVGRLTVVAFGMATVWACYLLGSALFGRAVGLVSAGILAVMPYHALVSRQVLLDAPQTLFNTLSLWAVAKYSETRRPHWLYGSALALGLSVLAKETAIILAGAFFVYFALIPHPWKWRHLLISGAAFGGVTLTYPLSLRVANSTRTGEAFLTYQLFRRPNHTMTFYLTEVPSAIGLVVVILALASIWLFRRSWRDYLLWIFVVVPVVFFELFPVKGYQYLLPIAPPLAVLAARTLVRWPVSHRLGRLPSGRTTRLSLGAAVTLSLLWPTWTAIQPTERVHFLAGTGGIPRGRELGGWVDRNTPHGVTIMTIGPSMANIIQWYGYRESRGLSVSPNPLNRNPVYDPLPNPDLSIRRNQVQYVVWDSFSADRTPHFSETLMRYVERYKGHELHREVVRVRGRSGHVEEQPVIIVFEVRPL